MNFADYIIDVGPKAGIHGGHLIAEGNIEQIKKNKKSKCRISTWKIYLCHWRFRVWKINITISNLI